MPFPFHTDRLILRAFAPRDAAAFSRYRSDPQVARYQGWDTPYTLAQAEQFVAAMGSLTPGAPGEWFQAAIELRATEALAGDCAFQVLAEDPRQAEIGFTLASEYQRQGIAVEAVGRLLVYLFEELGLHRVRANCDPLNEASAGLLRRLKFRHEGRFLQSLWFKGAWADEDWYALLRHEWLAQSAGSGSKNT